MTWIDGVVDLLVALCGTGTRYRPLRRNGDAAPDHRPPVKAADTVAALLADGWALVAPLAADLVVLDLDHCAEPGLLAALDRAAADHGAHLAYRAASGSDLSEHRAYAVPGPRRAGFRAAVADLRTRYGADGVVEHVGANGVRYRRDLDDRTADHGGRRARAGRGLRLPGSPSLKRDKGAVVWPLDADGLPVLSLHDAARMVRDARTAAGLTPEPAPTAPVADEPARGAHRPARRSPVAHTAVSWTARRVAEDMVAGWSSAERDRVLTEQPRGGRSHAALAALRDVVRHHGTEWDTVAPLVMGAGAFAKFSTRGEDAARIWWDRTATAYAVHRATHTPTAAEKDRDTVAGWLAHAWEPLLTRYGVERGARAWRALVHIGQRVMLDGRGLDRRRVAVRDLVDFGAAASPMTAWRALRDCEHAGVLTRDTEFTMDEPLVARRWSVPSDLRLDRDDTVRSHPLVRAVLSPALTHDGTAWLTHACWAAYAWTHTTMTDLPAALGASTRSTARWTHTLTSAGLAPADDCDFSMEAVEKCTVTCGYDAVLRLADARALVAVERELWAASVGRWVGALRRAARWRGSGRRSGAVPVPVPGGGPTR